MKVKVELFSVFRDAVGEKEIEFEINDDATIKDLLEAMAEKYPAIKKYIKFAVISKNYKWAKETEILKEGDIIAIFPPIGGG